MKDTIEVGSVYKNIDLLKSLKVDIFLKKRNKVLTAPFTRVCRLSICITQEDHVFRRSEFLFMLSSKTSGLIDPLV